jgi:hypothetical protein
MIFSRFIESTRFAPDFPEGFPTLTAHSASSEKPDLDDGH